MVDDETFKAIKTVEHHLGKYRMYVKSWTSVVERIH